MKLIDCFDTIKINEINKFVTSSEKYIRKNSSYPIPSILKQDFKT